MDSPSPSKCNARARRPVGMQGDVEVLLHWRWWHMKMDVLFKLVWMQLCLSFAVCVCVWKKIMQPTSVTLEWILIEFLLHGHSWTSLGSRTSWPMSWQPQGMAPRRSERSVVWPSDKLRCHWASFELCASIRTCCYKLLLLFDSSTCFFVVFVHLFKSFLLHCNTIAIMFLSPSSWTHNTKTPHRNHFKPDRILGIPIKTAKTISLCVFQGSKFLGFLIDMFCRFLTEDLSLKRFFFYTCTL